MEVEGTKESLVTDGQVTRGHTCHAKKLGFYLENFALRKITVAARWRMDLRRTRLDASRPVRRCWQ